MSNLMDLFKEALVYPISNIIILLTIGVMFLVSDLPSVLAQFGIDIYSGTVLLIFAIISFVVLLIVNGYGLSIIRDAISYNVQMPELDFMKNLVDGIKVLILHIIYNLIPLIITVIVASLTGVFSSIGNIIIFIGESMETIDLTSNATQVLPAIPAEYISTLLTGLAITAVVGIILALLFGLLYTIAICRLAKYDSLSEGLNFKAIFNDIKTIGIGKYIGWYILLIVIVMIISIIVGFIGAIPYIGVILVALLFTPFLIVFVMRALGLLYMDVEPYNK